RSSGWGRRGRAVAGGSIAITRGRPTDGPVRPRESRKGRPDGRSGELGPVSAQLTREFLERGNAARLGVRAPCLEPREQLLLRLRLLGPQRLETQLEVVDRLERRIAAQDRLEV